MTRELLENKKREALAAIELEISRVLDIQSEGIDMHDRIRMLRERAADIAVSDKRYVGTRRDCSGNFQYGALDIASVRWNGCVLCDEWITLACSTKEAACRIAHEHDDE